MDWRKQLDETLTQKQESEIRAWLLNIGEHDTELIAEVIARCRTQQQARQYFLMRSRAVSAT